jgi:choline-sulfatase
MYDLKSDPLERKNLARRGYKRTAEQQRQFERLKRKLARVQRKRL